MERDFPSFRGVMADRLYLFEGHWLGLDVSVNDP